MIDPSKRSQKEQDRERTRRRMHTQVDPENYEYIPEKKRVDYYDNDAPMRVAIYVRVSTDDVRQTTSFELQKKYYEDFYEKQLVMLDKAKANFYRFITGKHMITSVFDYSAKKERKQFRSF